MSKQEYLAIAAKRYDELQPLNVIDNFYDYESEFAAIMKDLGKEILEKNLRTLPAFTIVSIQAIKLLKTHPKLKQKPYWEIIFGQKDILLQH